jgi:hypothetical protein
VILDAIASALVLPKDYLWQVISTANHRYKTYPIPKRTGGQRFISHPARELKLLHYWLLENVFPRLRVHDAAMAYRTGRSIRGHALRHVHQNFLLKVDFRDFFPSIRKSDILRILEENAEGLTGILDSREDRELIGRIVCRNEQLTIGAPTSPILSNAVMFAFDAHWAARCSELHIIYSRYADDAYFSTSAPNVLSALLEEIREDLRQRESPSLRLNDQKTAFSSRKRRRLVTGIVLTSTSTISLGRQRKRQMRALVFNFVRGILTEQQTESLRGLVAYARSIEPAFVESLTRKYGPKFASLM